jgi:hypothetical protein
MLLKAAARARRSFHATLATPRLMKIWPAASAKSPEDAKRFFFLLAQNFLERRDQFSASAIQSARLEGSCIASCLHSAARELNSDSSSVPLPEADLFSQTYDSCRSPNYCPRGHRPNGQVTSKEDGSF